MKILQWFAQSAQIDARLVLLLQFATHVLIKLPLEELLELNVLVETKNLTMVTKIVKIVKKHAKLVLIVIFVLHVTRLKI